MNQAPVIQVNSPVTSFSSPGFKVLNQNEKQYAYHFARASWEGARICYFQRSYESPGLFYIFHKIFSTEKPQAVKQRLSQSGWSEEEVQQLFAYIAAVFQNCGNFKSFGDSKFIPEISQDKFEQFITTSPGYQVDQVWENVRKYIYNYDKPYGLIDLQEKNGSNSYYSNNLKGELLEAVDKFLIAQGVSELNTRVVKVEEEIHVLVASVNKGEKELGEVHNHKVKLVYGDFSPFLNSVVTHLTQALQYAANDNQKNMIQAYIEHFQTGDVELHKSSQRHWIKDKGPVIETNIGFIETYLDPLKVRAEWEGFVAVVNKEESALLNELVNKAEDIIKYLPWPKEFEVDVYKRPDFTSLEVLAFASSGTPLGINIPNYDDIRQTEGFKNVNLGNTIGKLSKDAIKFLDEADQEIFYKYQSEAVFLVVALHELIGHGAGKVFMKDKDGNLNFNLENTINPLTNQKVDSYYNHGEQWHSKFGEFSGAMEECKADATALYLSTYDDVVKLLLPNQSEEERRNTVFAGWLFVVHRAVQGLEFYNPEQKKWGQAHVLARNVILQSLIREDPDIIKITETQLNGKPYIHFKFDQSKLYTTGKKAISNLILHLQVFKSIGAGNQGVEFFSNLAAVSDKFLNYRNIVIQNKFPRRLEIQPNLVLEEGQVNLKEYEPTLAGIIESQVEHHLDNIETTKELFLNVQKLFQN
ncbi:unnamed protein product (macronuclear) [Paramecium tetraurelia]|uniref:Dipeptidyl peptidase 3 n=1 Tax=Paramecium tetraurelia TaxID=5888 RepID=A0DXU3_PARTE|nr:uncharacterized protein GSPATT00021484001 [Paramecium tetraurelia]CAK87860.1 unnamed protein product [Paramecium tetraurelia]|eukprot:XP_001455257.1 hypothetical protein (macronuclear) [Paramecium tetraurelia strain d4-2]